MSLLPISADKLAKDVVAIGQALIAEADPLVGRFQQSLTDEAVDDGTEIGFNRPTEPAA